MLLVSEYNIKSIQKKSHENNRIRSRMKVIRMHESMRPSVMYLRNTNGSLVLVIAMVTRCIMA